MGVSRAINLNTGNVFADRVKLAQTFFQRIRGLLGRAGLEKGEGLFIPGCGSIHTFFMRFSIDVLFLDKHNAITKAIHCMVPFRIAIGPWRTKSVLELECGTIEGKFNEGDIISFSGRST